MKVPFLDLSAQYETIHREIHQEIQQVLASSAFAAGPFVAKFEKNFAAFCGCASAIGAGNGTEALWLALLAVGVGPGDEVITVPNTFIATAEAISYCGAQPVFVDVDPRTYTMNPALLPPAITPRTKAVIPVHLFGQMADMDPILAIAQAHGLYVIEDASQAHGAKYKGKRAGTLGHAGCFSFYPGKNLGAYGEAGAVVTNLPEVEKKIRMLLDHGQSQKYYHDLIGWNARMDGIQGAVLDVKLKHLSAWNEARRQHAARYHELLRDIAGLRLPVEAAHARHVYHIYALRTSRRDALINALRRRDIHCGVHYPVPLHLQRAYRALRLAEGSFPVAEKCAREFVSLPMFPELRAEQIEYVAEAIMDFCQQNEASTA